MGVICAPALVCAPSPAFAVGEAGSKCSSFDERSQRTASDDVLLVDRAWRRTQYLAAGAYVTTECDDVGRPIREVTMALYPLPDGSRTYLPARTVHVEDGQRVEVDVTRGDMRAFRGDLPRVLAEAEAAGLPPNRSSKLSKAGAATRARLRPRHRKRALDYLNKCSDTTASYTNNRWWTGFGYYTNWNSLGASYRTDFTNQVMAGFHTWQFRTNYCGFSTSPEWIATAWLGDTNAVATNNGSTPVNNGINVVDFGYLGGGCAAALACTWKALDGGLGYAYANIRLNWDYGWSIGAQAPTHFDIWGVAAHEAGHALGAGDLYNGSASGQIMYYQAGFNESGRYLGAGDRRFLYDLYANYGN